MPFLRTFSPEKPKVQVNVGGMFVYLVFTKPLLREDSKRGGKEADDESGEPKCINANGRTGWDES